MKRYLTPVGAPKGGRVHWLLLSLNSNVWNYGYTVSYNYEDKSYCLFRKVKNTMRAVFIIIKTSTYAYRLSYHNFYTKKTLYNSFKSAKKCARFINAFVKDEILDEINALERNLRYITFIKNTKILLRLLRISQKTLATEIGVCQQTISKYLNNQVFPPEDVMEKIANFLGQSLEDMTTLK